MLDTPYILSSAAIVLVVLAFFVPWWPLALAGVLCAALTGQWVTAIMLGLVVDVAYGAPTGSLSVLLFPFTLIALATVLLRALLVRYIRPNRVY